jgi:hypothetical protein
MSNSNNINYGTFGDGVFGDNKFGNWSFLLSRKQSQSSNKQIPPSASLSVIKQIIENTSISQSSFSYLPENTLTSQSINDFDR